jgi:hypothetical protein
MSLQQRARAVALPGSCVEPHGLTAVAPEGCFGRNLAPPRTESSHFGTGLGRWVALVVYLKANLDILQYSYRSLQYVRVRLPYSMLQKERNFV